MGLALPFRFRERSEMTSNSTSQDGSTIMTLMTLLTVITVFFMGFHGSGVVSSTLTCHQFTSFSCFSSICLAILMVIILLTIFLISSVTLIPNPAFTSDLVYTLGRPPKK